MNGYVSGLMILNCCSCIICHRIFTLIWCVYWC